MDLQIQKPRLSVNEYLFLGGVNNFEKYKSFLQKVSIVILVCSLYITTLMSGCNKVSDDGLDNKYVTPSDEKVTVNCENMEVQYEKNNIIDIIRNNNCEYICKLR